MNKLLFTICFLLMAIIVLLALNLNNGRYTYVPLDDSAGYILDTKTSQMWIRGFMDENILSIYIGTNEKTAFRAIEKTKKEDMSEYISF